MKEDFADKKVEASGNYRGVPKDVFTAVHESFEESIGHLVEDRAVHWFEVDEDEAAFARFSFEYFEIPAVDGDGALEGWHPPYRCRELVDEELRERLPEGVHAEAKNNTTTDLYGDR